MQNGFLVVVAQPGIEVLTMSEPASQVHRKAFYTCSYETDILELEIFLKDTFNFEIYPIYFFELPFHFFIYSWLKQNEAMLQKG